MCRSGVSLETCSNIAVADQRYARWTGKLRRQDVRFWPKADIADIVKLIEAAEML